METKSIVYPVGFYFELTYKDEKTAFQEVSGISKELNMEEVVCGGENRFKYRLPTTSTSQNLVLKRGICSGNSKLIDWCVASIDGGLSSKIQTNDLTINLLNSSGEVCVGWTFHNAYPVKYAVSDLKSQENKIVVESLEFAYTYFQVTENNFSTIFE